jgi:hypothetical protein
MKPQSTTPVTDTIRDDLALRVLAVTPHSFDDLALDIFRYQFSHNPFYHQYCVLLNKDIRNVREVTDIPFLPVSTFRHHDIRTNVWEPAMVFRSSTTASQIAARHAVRDITFYHTIAAMGFATAMHRDISAYLWLALLPNYHDRPDSSLIAMVDHFISQGKAGGQYIDLRNAAAILTALDGSSATPVACIGVSFALLDLADRIPLHLHNTIIIETGGMKGRRIEPPRSELHSRLCERFDIRYVCSEYGMTEMLSQAWSLGEGIFIPGPSLRIYTRDLSDPLSIQAPGMRGAINCIDLANVDTCAFLATDDVGYCHPDGRFEILGRLDTSELRGCNLMASEIMQ